MLFHQTYIKSPNHEWVTFVHGAGGSSTIWYKQIREFRKHFNVLLIDLRGHGRSQVPLFKNLKRYTFQLIGNEVLEVLDHLSIRSTHFIGISLGTIVIRDITERFPERSRSMILGGAVMKLNLRGRILMKLGIWVQSFVPYILLYRLFAFIIMPSKKQRESRNLFIREAKKIYRKEFKRWFTLASQVGPLLSLFRFKDSGIPTLYIMGSEDYMFLPSISRLVRDHLSSRLVILHECGHVVNVEQPKAFNEHAIGFINQLQ